MPKVSILLTTYNRPEMLKKAVDSVESQTYKDYELIILDDNSDDPKQLELIKDYEKRHVVIRSSVRKEDRQKTVRYCVMINLGLKIATGSLITYLCDDDYYNPLRLEKMVEYLDKRQDINVIYSCQETLTYKDGIYTHYGDRTATHILDNACSGVDHSSVMHRKSVLAKLGNDPWPIDTSYWNCGDAGFWGKLHNEGYRFYPLLTAIPLDYHIFHAKSWSEDRWKNL